MKEKQNRIVYFDEKGQKHEIPLHLTKASIEAKFRAPTEIKITALCKKTEESRLWIKFLDYLSPIMDIQKIRK